jgi:hypothetical protein
MISISFQVYGQAIGDSAYDDCIKKNLNDTINEMRAITIRQSCFKTYGNLDAIGWDLGDSGIGACHMIWTGAGFSQTSLRQSPSVYSTQILNTPKKFDIIFYVPKVFEWSELKEPEILNEIAKLFGGDMPKYACGYSTQ